MGNINQYYFEKLQNSEIIITEPIFERLVAITNLTGFNIEEHMCFLLGREKEENKIIFDEMNQNVDYITNGSGSNNPLEHGVEPGRNTNISKEIKEWINNASDKNIICDIHTHPSGVSEGDEYRIFSGADIENNIEFTQKMNEKGIKHIAGLISVDNNKGNTSISFVWFDESQNKFYRVSNVSIAKYNEVEKKWSKTRLPRKGNTEFLEMDFGRVDFYNREEELEL